MAGASSTRRRSNSTGDAAANLAAAAAAASNNKSSPNSSAANTDSSVAASRPKRRARGLPTLKINTTTDPPVDSTTVASAVASAGNGAGSRTTVRTPRGPPRVRGAAATATLMVLQALSPEGKHISLSVKVGGKYFTVEGDNQGTANQLENDVEQVQGKSPPLPLGHDGNTFYCQECDGVGDVVCCDGCPRVYHGHCVPEGPSRDTLDHDNWYCPICYLSKADTTATTIETNSVVRTCFECNERDTQLQQCESCEGWIHVPKCPGDDDDDDLSDDSDDESPRKIALQQRLLQAQLGRILCKICRVETLEQERVKQESHLVDEEEDEGDEVEYDDNDHDDDEEQAAQEVREEDYLSSAHDDPQPDVEPEAASPLSTEETPRDNKRGSAKAKKVSLGSVSSPHDTLLPPRKRTRLSLPSSKVKENMDLPTPSPAKPVKTPKTANDRKKSKQKNPRLNEEEDSVGAASEILNHALGYPKAIPAFFYFLNENRQKLERHLARKHRTFIRLPKGLERNELVAQEAGVWWGTLNENEVRRYMELSMQDFEAKIIEWKEEKTIREMLLEHENIDEEYDDSFEDEVLNYENHRRLYLGTNVGSKPYKPDPESLSTQNRVLLELLQDTRFHPMPMMQVNRTEEEYGQMDFDRVTIPYFDVHGPYSTSVGDECLGCARGWVHFCPVLKRRMPAVDYRARLQPALSSLVATRVGLGLRPKLLPHAKVPDTIDEFSTWERPEVNDIRNLPMEATETLSAPSARVDDVVQFIEEIHAMKVPEPPRPDFPKRLDISHKSSDLNRSNRTSKKRSFDTLGGEGSNAATLMKCGRCRTVIGTDTGCIQCRRAQLVINLSKRPLPGQEDSSRNEGTSVLGDSSTASRGYRSLKVQTQMCGRISIKEGSVEGSNDPDTHVAYGILRQRWTPFAVLPPTTVLSPTPKSKLNHRPQRIEDASSDDENDGDDGDNDVPPSNVSEGESSDHGDDISESSKSSNGAGNAVAVDDDAGSAAPEAPQASGSGQSKRLRSARIAAGTNAVSKEAPSKEVIRHEQQARFKQESDDFYRKCLERACCGILLGLMRRDPLLLFASPVSAEGYSAVIPHPMDFGMIREQVLEGKYTSLGSFVADCRLLCTNALAYNPPGSLYWKCAKELFDVLAVMQSRAQKWMTVLKDTHAATWRCIRNEKEGAGGVDDGGDRLDVEVNDPFSELRTTWPEAIDLLEDSEWLRRQIQADFMRTRENEVAYYAALAVRRTAAGAETAMAPYPDSGGVYNVVSRRSHVDDEALRRSIDERVSEITHPIELKDLPGWREDSIMRILRRAQTRRLDGISTTNVGCARCDGTPDDVKNQSKSSQLSRLSKYKPKRNEQSRIDPSRENLSSGMSSQTTRARIQSTLAELVNEKDWNTKAQVANQVAVTVRGSGIHGWGLYADQFFKKGDVVAEYIGEYVSLAVTEAREKLYRDHRIQDYQFRVDDSLVIDATLRGGHGRYINHNCSPNCIAKIIPGVAPNEHLKRVLIIAQRKIEPREELTYDYQFPLESDLNSRIPCNCMSDQCRGFMNWDLPEKGSATQSFRTQKRGANMRDRIRRLGRPLKGEKGGGDAADDDDDDDDDDST